MRLLKHWSWQERVMQHFFMKWKCTSANLEPILYCQQNQKCIGQKTGYINVQIKELHDGLIPRKQFSVITEEMAK